MTTDRKTILLSAGMLATVLYVLHVVIGGFLWKEYSHLQQPISDLTATGAPNRTFLLSLTSIYGVLAIIFAWSFTILESKKHHKLVFWGGIFFTILHFISISYGLFPQDLPNQPVTFLGRMHIVVTVLIVPFTILTPLFIGLGFIKEPNWKKFGVLSILTAIGICIFGGTTAAFYANKLPYFGIVERINIGILQVWTFYFSYKLTMLKNA